LECILSLVADVSRQLRHTKKLFNAASASTALSNPETCLGWRKLVICRGQGQRKFLMRGRGRQQFRGFEAGDRSDANPQASSKVKSLESWDWKGTWLH